MGFKSTFKRFFDLEEEQISKETENQKEALESGKVSPFPREIGQTENSKSKVVSLKSVQKNTRVILIEPTKYDDVLTIAEHLKNRKAVVFNVKLLEKQEATRVIDFISGAVYLSNGTIKKVSATAFLCALDNVDISGDILES